jgi:hypothetical protein
MKLLGLILLVSTQASALTLDQPILKSLRGGAVAISQDTGGELLTGSLQYSGPFFSIFTLPIGFQGGATLFKDTQGSVHPAFDLGLAPRVALSPGVALELNLGLNLLPFAGDESVDFLERLTQAAAFVGAGARFPALLPWTDGTTFTYRRAVVIAGWHEFRLCVEVQL